MCQRGWDQVQLWSTDRRILTMSQRWDPWECALRVAKCSWSGRVMQVAHEVMQVAHQVHVYTGHTMRFPQHGKLSTNLLSVIRCRRRRSNTAAPCNPV